MVANVEDSDCYMLVFRFESTWITLTLSNDSISGCWSVARSVADEIASKEEMCFMSETPMSVFGHICRRKRNLARLGGIQCKLQVTSGTNCFLLWLEKGFQEELACTLY